MTVAELIAALKEFDPQLPVRYSDYEQGPTDVDDVMLASARHQLLRMSKPFDGDEYVLLD